LSILQFPAVNDREFLFEIPNLCCIQLFDLWFCFDKFNCENLPALDIVDVEGGGLHLDKERINL
jgi:hypothetical protein